MAGRPAGLTGWALVASVGYGIVLGGIILAPPGTVPAGHEPFRP